jgi:hypothetical protein
MGCDIHAHAERKTTGGYELVPDVVPFDWRSYGMYGFLAGVRNYSAVPSIAERRGLPDDMSAGAREEYEHWELDAHSASWLALDELLAFDYDRPLEDRRVMRNGDGGCTCDAGEGEMTTFREFLGPAFFDDLDALKEARADRVVFWFDN